MIFSIMTTVKIKVDKLSLKVLFKTMAKMNNYMNETSFVHSITKRRLQIEAQAQAADFIRPINFLTLIFGRMAAHGCEPVIGLIMIWSTPSKDGKVWELSIGGF